MTILEGRTASPEGAMTYQRRTQALAEVVTGMRSPLDRMSEAHLRPEDAARTRLHKHAAMARTPREGERVYVSGFAKLRIQLKAVRGITDQITGQRNPGENLVASFKNGEFRVREDAWVTPPGSPGAPKGLLIVDVLEDKMRCPSFNVDFFRYEDIVNQMETDAVEEAASIVSNLSPAARDKVLESLTAPRADIEGSKMPVKGKEEKK